MQHVVKRQHAALRKSDDHQRPRTDFWGDLVEKLRECGPCSITARWYFQIQIARPFRQ